MAKVPALQSMASARASRHSLSARADRKETMQLTISREVIDSIKLARDFQVELDDLPRSCTHDARVAINNGARVELTLRSRNLSPGQTPLRVLLLTFRPR